MTKQYDAHPLIVFFPLTNKMFEYRFIRFFYSYEEGMFMPIQFNTMRTFREYHEQLSKGIDQDHIYRMSLIKYGESVIEVPLYSVPVLLIEEILNPFYVFEIFSMILWFSDGYRMYACVILIISVISITVSLVETKRNMKNIHHMAYYSCLVNVMRDGS